MMRTALFAADPLQPFLQGRYFLDRSVDFLLHPPFPIDPRMPLGFGLLFEDGLERIEVLVTQSDLETAQD